jgi:isopentenyl diphosphate isomerase/L-lactate dehydrogenase-like FMN-dependent dehydrogenase
VVRWIEGFVDELRTALFVTGVASAEELTSRWSPASRSARA